MAESTLFVEIYRSDLQGVYALWVVPALFLAWLALAPAGRAAFAASDPAVRFVAWYCVVFGVETIVDPWVTGPLLRRLGTAEASLGTAVIVAFVLVGDFRVFLLLLRIADPRAGLGTVLRDAALWTLVVPLVAFGADRALHEMAPGLGSQSIWLVYELAFLAMALWLRQRAIPAWVADDPPRRRALQAIAGYVALYYGLWASADVLIQGLGLDLGWALRIVPNQLYYAFYLPFVFFQLALRPSSPASQSTQASR